MAELRHLSNPRPQRIMMHKPVSAFEVCPCLCVSPSVYVPALVPVLALASLCLRAGLKDPGPAAIFHRPVAAPRHQSQAGSKVGANASSHHWRKNSSIR
eukprot:2532575-Alexandrium_andersonii.AAC.1